MSFVATNVRSTLTRNTSIARLSSLQSHLASNRVAQGTALRKMSSVPSKMKAVVLDKTGGPEVLRYAEDEAVPKISDSQVLVHNKFAGINYIDTYFRTGLYPAAKWPLILGQEGVGTIAAVGGTNNSGLKEGDEVVYMTQGTSSI